MHAFLWGRPRRRGNIYAHSQALAVLLGTSDAAVVAQLRRRSRPTCRPIDSRCGEPLRCKHCYKRSSGAKAKKWFQISLAGNFPRQARDETVAEQKKLRGELYLAFHSAEPFRADLSLEDILGRADIASPSDEKHQINPLKANAGSRHESQLTPNATSRWSINPSLCVMHPGPGSGISSIQSKERTGRFQGMAHDPRPTTHMPTACFCYMNDRTSKRVEALKLPGEWWGKKGHFDSLAKQLSAFSSLKPTFAIYTCLRAIPT
ncbi:hypothetical protein CIRG_03951 [Coccidioides immitis RMSCC 2394]|uniref:Uncharacterized protein n=1 Tax=Coccidioides immitis RMSCC 2394 TaxID=404692 RepID=A0A0J6Y953_COCIT|nr:hypothetical protein CIRG_03951 [Coccidioides immitis RMSCC 2394]